MIIFICHWAFGCSLFFVLTNNLYNQVKRTQENVYRTLCFVTSLKIAEMLQMLCLLYYLMYLSLVDTIRLLKLISSWTLNIPKEVTVKCLKYSELIILFYNSFVLSCRMFMFPKLPWFVKMKLTFILRKCHRLQLK